MEQGFLATMSDERTLLIAVGGRPIVEICGTDRALASFARAAPDCQRHLPGWNVRPAAAPAGPLRTPTPFALRLIWSAAERPQAAARGPYVELSGRTDQLPLSLWPDLLLTLAAHALAPHGLFFAWIMAVQRPEGIILLVPSAGPGAPFLDSPWSRTDAAILGSGYLLVDDQGQLHLPPSDSSGLAAGRTTAFSIAGWCTVRSRQCPAQLVPLTTWPHRAVLASHVLSAALRRPAVVGAWEWRWEEVPAEASEQRLRAAISTHARLPHWQFDGRTSEWFSCWEARRNECR